MRQNEDMVCTYCGQTGHRAEHCPVRVQEVLKKCCYLTSGSYLSGYRVTIGFYTSDDAHEAHVFLAKACKDANQPKG